VALHSRIRRINEELKAIIADIIANEVKDPRLGNVMVTVTQVNTSNDLHQAQVYVSVLGTDEQTADVMAALRRSQSFIRREVAAQITFRFMPELFFRLDETGRNAAHINQLLKTIEKQNPDAFKPEPTEESEATEKPTGDENE
jgi:ribosome-binding factor A